MTLKWLMPFIGLVALPSQAELDRTLFQKILPSVVRVQAYVKAGVASGSAVVVAPGKVVSNCHVTRDAMAINVIAWSSKWKVKEQIKDIDHDLCLLILHSEIGKVAEFADASEIKIGQTVAAAGYPSGGRLEVTEGQIRSLHNLDGGRVIQSSAPFAQGESGGGLFDKNGRLVGIIAFRGAHFFALPAAWVKRLLDSEANDLAGANQTVAFWEREPDNQPNFLQADAREFLQDWAGLKVQAERWTKEETTNPESWIALGKSLYHLKRHPDAIPALRKAAELDPQNSLGWFYLAQAYRDTHDTKAFADAIEKLSALDPSAAQALSAEVELPK
ncbi:MAG: trypsin-like peptidase domain-containing protein [Pseudomonadota bacterium]|nr:trypsin-like peptidase domain-containing protein [Pseudomonadota bacterium]